MRSGFAAIVFSIGIVAGPAAQEAVDPLIANALVPGAQVRVRATSISFSPGVLIKETRPGPGVVGAVERVEAGEVTLTRGQDRIRIPLASITAVDRSVGSRRQWLIGLLAGVGVGLTAGATAPVEANNCGSTSSSFCSRREAIGFTVLAGAGLGAAVGALVKSTQWERRFTKSP